MASSDPGDASRHGDVSGYDLFGARREYDPVDDSTRFAPEESTVGGIHPFRTPAVDRLFDAPIAHPLNNVTHRAHDPRAPAIAHPSPERPDLPPFPFMIVRPSDLSRPSPRPLSVTGPRPLPGLPTPSSRTLSQLPSQLPSLLPTVSMPTSALPNVSSQPPPLGSSQAPHAPQTSPSRPAPSAPQQPMTAQQLYAMLHQQFGGGLPVPSAPPASSHHPQATQPQGPRLPPGTQGIQRALGPQGTQGTQFATAVSTGREEMMFLAPRPDKIHATKLELHHAKHIPELSRAAGNWLEWSEKVVSFVNSSTMVGYVEGWMVMPDPNADYDAASEWVKANNVILAFMREKCAPEERQFIAKARTAFDAYNLLKGHFSHPILRAS